MVTIVNPPVKLPLAIVLPDGREIPLAEILGRVTNIENINVRTQHRVNRMCNGAPRMSEEERRFRALSTIEEIQARYNCDVRRARVMKHLSRRQLGIPTRVDFSAKSEFA